MNEFNEALRWVQQAMMDYANSMPIAAREATAERADKALSLIRRTLIEALEAANAPKPDSAALSQ